VDSANQAEVKFYPGSPLPLVADQRNELDALAAPEAQSTSRRAIVNVFDLSDKEQFKKYQAVINAVAAGIITLSMEEQKYDDTTKNWRVLIRYIFDFTSTSAFVNQYRRSSFEQLREMELI
jgi:hypothetical protein